MVKISGEQILLRDWEREDLEQYRHWQTGEHLWKELDGPYYQNLNNKFSEVLSKLEEKILAKDFPQPRKKLVIADKKSNLLMGTVNSYWLSEETNWLAAGITIFNPQAWGRGLGKEALILWINYLFANRPGLARLDLQTWSGNKAMEKLALKLGFKLEGCFRKARIVKGEYFDSLHFGILKEEWVQGNKG